MRRVTPGWRYQSGARVGASLATLRISFARKALVSPATPLVSTLGEAQTLAPKLAVMLVQLPPKLAFDVRVAQEFFARIRNLTSAQIACEPRHASWFGDEAANVLREFAIARVAADPAICDTAARPGAWGGLSYWRLHGSPVVYRSSYADRIDHYAAQLTEESATGKDVCCIFDNTASSAGAADALMLIEALRSDLRA